MKRALPPPPSPLLSRHFRNAKRTSRRVTCPTVVPKREVLSDAAREETARRSPLFFVFLSRCAPRGSGARACAPTALHLLKKSRAARVIRTSGRKHENGVAFDESSNARGQCLVRAQITPDRISAAGRPEGQADEVNDPFSR